MSDDLRRDFAGRDDLVRYVRERFPAALDPENVSPIQGGRDAADELLAKVDPARYAATRNHLDGAVTRLSPYLRHGVVSLPEVRESALSKVSQPPQAGKLINELAWRDYWRRVYAEIGDGVWDDREDLKTTLMPEDYAGELPDDVREGRTGLVCIDAFVDELVTTGYIHNHARMWLAAYVVHWRRVRWQAGARWFLTHLLDGDPASNNLSWQWVAGTFSQKPYIFNRENLERHTGGAYCRDCPLAGGCDFQGGYEALERRLFGLPLAPPPPRGRRKR